MKTRLLLSIAFCLITQLIGAQPNNDFHSLPSPDAYALGKYYDIPVDKSNGLPNISIPLSMVEIGGLSLPLNLSYHSSGLRVSEISSNVGLGWSLGWYSNDKSSGQRGISRR